MKKNIITKRFYQLTFALLFVLLIMPSISNAQPGFENDETDVPFDGGLTLMIAAGVGYGIKKMRDKKKAAVQKD